MSDVHEASSPPTVPPRLLEYAAQTVTYVQRALGVPLEFDSDTLPVLDHYLRSVPSDQPATVQLVLATAGAYFGEVVRRLLGGRWEQVVSDLDDDGGGGRGDDAWRLVLPTGLSFSPVGFVASAIARADLEDHDTNIDAPARMRPFVQQALQRMGDVTEDDYYSLCGRLDTLEHVHEVLVAVAAQMLGDAGDPDAADDAGAGAAPAADADDDPADRAPTAPVDDDASGRVN